MKKIYLVMTHTGTTFSKMIRKHTGNTYNHISLAFKEDLSEMYSFGRRNAYIFFYGGFIVESPSYGTFKRFKQTVAKVYELEVEDAAYGIIQDCINRFLAEKKKFGYNIRGIFKARKNLNYQKTYRKFYCSQFVHYVLVCAHVIPEDFFDGIVVAEKFASIPGMKLIYEGLLREYSVKDENLPLLSEEEGK